MRRMTRRVTSVLICVLIFLPAFNVAFAQSEMQYSVPMDFAEQTDGSGDGTDTGSSTDPADAQPSVEPSMEPSAEPSAEPSVQPDAEPSIEPSAYAQPSASDPPEEEPEPYTPNAFTTLDESDWHYTSISGGIEITGYDGTDTDVVVPQTIGSSSVISIGYGAFQDLTTIKTITLPSTLQYIDDAYYDTFPESLTDIFAESANPYFSSVDGVLFNKTQTKFVFYPAGKTDTDYSIPDGVTSLGKNAMAKNSHIINIIIPGSVRAMEWSAFEVCSNLQTATIQEGVTIIGDFAFNRCGNLSSVTLPSTLESVGRWAFHYTKLTTLTIPENVSSIGEYAFADCDFLESIQLPSGLNTIEQFTFSSCPVLSEIVIPESVTAIGKASFFDCQTLDKITLPGQVESLGDIVFERCTKLEQVHFMGNAPALGTDVFYETAPYFVILYDADTTGWATPTWHGYPCYPYEGYGFDYQNINGGTEAEITGYWGANPDAVVPSSIAGLPVTQIAQEAFSDRTDITSVTIPDSVSGIGSDAFYGCESLEAIYIDETNGYFKDVDGVLFSQDVSTLIRYPEGKEGSTYTIQGGVTTVAGDAFANCGNLTGITIPESVTTIGSMAFFNCQKLASISVDSANNDFSSANGILFDKAGNTLVQYPAGKTLSSYTVPESVTSIGEAAFAYNTYLRSVSLPSQITEIPIAAFFYCPNLNTVSIPDGITSIDIYAFSLCTAIETVTVPDSVTEIGEKAFSACISLETAYFEGDATAGFASDIFENTSAGFTIYFAKGASGWTTPVWNGYSCYPYDTKAPTLTGILPEKDSIIESPAFEVTAQGVADPSGVANVRFAVWSATGGEDDMKWYDGTNDGEGNWTVSVNRADHNSDIGIYYINIYGTDNLDNSGLMGTTSIIVRNYMPPTKLTLGYDTSDPTGEETFGMYATVDGGSETIASVRFNAFNTAVGRSSQYSYDGTYADGTWTATFDLANHGGINGKYAIELLATDTDGIEYYLGYKYVTVTVEYLPPVKVSLGYDTTDPTNETSFGMNAVVDGRSATIASVRFNAFNTAVGRSSQHSYDGTYADGEWTATFDLASHGGKSGKYAIELLATDTGGIEHYLGYKYVTVTVEYLPPVKVSLGYDTTDPTNETSFGMNAVVDGRSATIASVRFNAFNTAVGRSSQHSYDGTYADGTWTATFDLASHGGKSGKYAIELLATDTDGIEYYLGYKYVTVTVEYLPPVKVSLGYDTTDPTNESTFGMNAVVDGRSATIASVRFNAFNTAVGRSSQHSYDGTYADGTWTATFDLASHGGKSGKYAVELLATDTGGIEYYLGYKYVTVTVEYLPPVKVSLGYDTTDPTNETSFGMNAVVDGRSATIASVRFNAFNTAVGRSSQYSYAGTYADGEWTATFDLSNHGGTAGKYAIELLATDTDGIEYYLGYKYVTVTVEYLPPVKVSLGYDTTDPTNETSFGMNAVVDGRSATIASVRFNAFNTAVGRSSQYSYAGTYADGTWTATFDLASHGGTAGKYAVELLATDTGGIEYYLGYKYVTVTVEYLPPVKVSLGYDTTDPTNETSFGMNAVVDGRSATIASVRFNAFNTAVGRSSQYSYDGTYADGEWTADFDLANHGWIKGRYAIELLAKDTGGNEYYLGYKYVTIDPPPPAPENLNAAADSYSGINVSFDPVGDAEGYEIWRSTSSNGTYANIKTFGPEDSLSFTDSDIAPDTEYYYKVRVYANRSGNMVYSAFTDPQSAKIITPDPPDAPHIQNSAMWFQNYVTNAWYIEVHWDSVANADGFELWRGSDTTGPLVKYKTIDRPNGSGISDDNVDNIYGYSYVVYAYKKVGNTLLYSVASNKQYSGIRPG